MKKSKQQKHYESLVHQLEDAVLALEAAGQSEQDIFSLVHMIQKGWIRGGVLTDEYVALAREAKRMREIAEQAELAGQRKIIIPGQ